MGLGSPPGASARRRHCVAGPVSPLTDRLFGFSSGDHPASGGALPAAEPTRDYSLVAFTFIFSGETADRRFGVVCHEGGSRLFVAAHPFN